jgi:pilus assembly protein CpaB
LAVAALIAAVGAGMVFLYVRSVDSRAEASQQPVQVLKAVALISPGERLSDAESAGKIKLGNVPRKEVLNGAVNSTASLGDDVALSTIYPNEQIITSKFGAPGDASNLTIPDGNIAISVTLSDTGRVAGFVSPGNNVAVFVATQGDQDGSDSTRLLLPKVQVIAVGDTTVISKTTTSASGNQTTEQLPKTLFTLSVNQREAEKVLYAASHGELSFGLLNDKSQVAADSGVNSSNLFK